MNTYYDVLINKIFKLLPLMEEKNLSYNQYLNSLLRELKGNKDLFNNPELFTIIGTLNNLPKSHREFKSEIFKCISILDKLKNKNEGDNK